MSNYEIKFAGFEKALALKNAVASAVSTSGLDLEKLDLSKGLASDIDVGNIIKVVCGLDSSPEVQAAIFACLEHSLYNEEKITKQTFDDIDAVADYYPIVLECIKVNLSPFFKKLASMSKGLNLEKIITSQK